MFVAPDVSGGVYQLNSLELSCVRPGGTQPIVGPRKEAFRLECPLYHIRQVMAVLLLERGLPWNFTRSRSDVRG